jgi:hypothetical protein
MIANPNASVVTGTDLGPSANDAGEPVATMPVTEVQAILHGVDMRAKAFDQVMELVKDGSINLDEKNAHGHVLDIAEVHLMWLNGASVDDLYPPAVADNEIDSDSVPKAA